MPTPKIDKKELALATSLVEQMITTFADIDTVDHYHEALRKLIDSKIKGKKVTEFEKYEEPASMDIMTALKKSLQASSRKPMVKAEPRDQEKGRAYFGQIETRDGEETEGWVGFSRSPAVYGW